MNSVLLQMIVTYSTLIRSTTAADFVSRNAASPDSIDTAMQTISIITPDSQLSETSASMAVMKIVLYRQF